MARVVVIGAGMGGLAVAARLGRAGHDVLVLEASAAIGGKLGRLERDGYRFDTGPHLLTLPAVYRDLFRSTGRPLERYVDLVACTPAARYRFGDGTWLDLPNTGRHDVADALGDTLGGTAAADWARLMDRAARVWDLTRDTVIGAPVSGPLDLARLARRPGDVRVVAPLRSLRRLGRATLADPRLVTLLDRYATYTGSDPRAAPAALVTVPYVEQVFGSWYVAGGLYRLGEALATRVGERRGRIRCDAPVVEVLIDAGRACGVRLADGERIPADVVVSDADASRLYGGLLPGAARAAARSRRRLARTTPSLSGFVLLLAVGPRPDRRRTPGLAHHSVLFPAEYDAEFDAIFGDPGRPVADPTIYLSVPDDPAIAPAGGEAWFVLVNAPRHGTGPGALDWRAPGLADAYARRILDLLAARGYDVRDRVRFMVVRTPADLEELTGAPGGAIYGTSSNGARAAFARPANRSPVPGLFLVGGSAHPGGGLPLVGMSAAIVADLVGPA